ncbi:GNAT family N-acetyltransferase [Rhodobacterales bacterium HKCCE2091]|nr:GNAT family N-acetyltransferase [Rhodobacterales bacterium HKCCE2091]
MPLLHTEADTLELCEGLVPVTTVALRAGRPVGFLSRRGSEVLTLFLARSERGQGTGKRLLDAAKAECPQLSLWTFAANDRARAFYAREGFAETGGTAGDNDEGLPDIRLEWSRR